MNSTVVALIGTILGWISQYGVAGQIIAAILGSLSVVSTVVTALVGIWHGVVALILALSAAPYIGPKLASLAAALQADSAKVDADANQVLAFLAQFSSIPLPTKPVASS
jgi:hypothetical protein